MTDHAPSKTGEFPPILLALLVIAAGIAFVYFAYGSDVGPSEPGVYAPEPTYPDAEHIPHLYPELFPPESPPTSTPPPTYRVRPYFPDYQSGYDYP